jgi:hypothetical protein
MEGKKEPNLRVSVPVKGFIVKRIASEYVSCWRDTSSPNEKVKSDVEWT